jgi:hypothetical protein
MSKNCCDWHQNRGHRCPSMPSGGLVVSVSRKRHPNGARRAASALCSWRGEGERPQTATIGGGTPVHAPLSPANRNPTFPAANAINRAAPASSPWRSGLHLETELPQLGRDERRDYLPRADAALIPVAPSPHLPSSSRATPHLISCHALPQQRLPTAFPISSRATRRNCTN